jgi:hypothetical protein
VTILCDLCIVGRVPDGRVSYEPQLGWVTTAKLQYGSSIVYYIDARTGELIFRDTTLDEYGDVFVRDPDEGGEPTYECALDIYHRLDSATTLHPRYYEDPTHSEEVSQLQYEQLLYHIGHGGFGYYGSEVHTYLYTDTDHIWPSDVENLDLSGVKLAFLCGCWTAANNYPVFLWWWEDIDKSLAEGFLEGGAQCVFGWDESVLKTEAMTFSRYFFDYAVYSYNFEVCYDYAYSKVSSGTQDIARIYGDDSLYLDKYDFGTDGWPGTNLGSGYDVVFYVYDEGLWDPDVDWYRFTVSGSRVVNIWAVPNNDDLDIASYVYDEYMQVVFYRDSYGPGHQESGYFSAGGQTYFLYIYKTDTHGGYYDLTVGISS